jgi:hypothetical protein
MLMMQCIKKTFEAKRFISIIGIKLNENSRNKEKTKKDLNEKDLPWRSIPVNVACITKIIAKTYVSDLSCNSKVKRITEDAIVSIISCKIVK